MQLACSEGSTRDGSVPAGPLRSQVGPRSVLFLDEISTGLDSATLFTIIKWLSQVSVQREEGGAWGHPGPCAGVESRCLTALYIG